MDISSLIYGEETIGVSGNGIKPYVMKEFS